MTRVDPAASCVVRSTQKGWIASIYSVTFRQIYGEL